MVPITNIVVTFFMIGPNLTFFWSDRSHCQHFQYPHCYNSNNMSQPKYHIIWKWSSHWPDHSQSQQRQCWKGASPPGSAQHSPWKWDWTNWENNHDVLQTPRVIHFRAIHSSCCHQQGPTGTQYRPVPETFSNTQPGSVLKIIGCRVTQNIGYSRYFGYTQ